MYCLLVLAALYAGSLLNGRNTFPQHIFMIPVIMGLWGVMMILSAVSDHMIYKSKNNDKKISK
jgi:hypothetical protein